MGKYYEHKKTKSGYLICAVPSCQTKKSTTTLKTFEFPSDLKRRNLWISAIVENTLKMEEESTLIDLYALENKRIELEMEISSVLGDHSYVCARHFEPEDIIVHTHVCRLTSNAVPSIFENYPTDLPRQFFKRICQRVENIKETLINCSANTIKSESQDDSDASYEVISPDCTDLDPDDCAEENPIFIPSSPYESNHFGEIQQINESNDVSEEDIEVDEFVETNFSISDLYMSKHDMRKRLLSLEIEHCITKKRLRDVEDKHKLYNIDVLERDAENNNEEARFLLDMLQSYSEFEHTRNEILSMKSS